MSSRTRAAFKREILACNPHRRREFHWPIRSQALARNVKAAAIVGREHCCIDRACTRRVFASRTCEREVVRTPHRTGERVVTPASRDADDSRPVTSWICREPGSNRRHQVFQTCALPTELSRRLRSLRCRKRDRRPFAGPVRVPWLLRRDQRREPAQGASHRSQRSTTLESRYPKSETTTRATYIRSTCSVSHPFQIV